MFRLAGGAEVLVENKRGSTNIDFSPKFEVFLN